MNLSRSRGLAVAVLCSAVLTAACGLKPEVKDTLAQSGGGLSQGTGQVAVDANGDGAVDAFVPADGTTTGTDPAAGGTATDPAAAGGGGTTSSGGAVTSSGGGTTSSGGGSGTSSGGGTTSSGGGAKAPAGGGTTGAAPAAETPLGPDSKIGIDDKAKTIRIALHGPLTGAGVPQDSFKSGTPKYWDNGGKPRLIKGYRVIAEAFDDKYQPGPAVKACNAKAKTEFLIVGGAGTDQIQACARSSVLARGNVPYISAGVTENGLGGLKNYFATSLTYPKQARLVVAMAKNGGYLAPKNGKGWAIVISNTPNFLDAEQAIVAELQKAGQKATVIRTPKSGADSTTVANRLREGGFESVYFLGQPLFFIELVGKAGCPAYCPQWAGVGVSMGVNSVHNLACNGSRGGYKGEFLSPYPGLDMAPKLAPGVQFKDDIEFSIYGSSQILEQMLQAVPGPSFSRESFIAAVQGKTFKGGIFPNLTYTNGRFGGTGAYALKSDCSKVYKTNGFYE